MTQMGAFAERDQTLVGYDQPRLPFVAVVVGVFVLGAVTVSPLEGWNYLVKGLGVVLAAAYLISSIRSRLLPSGEMVLYVVWVTWSLTGVFVARSGILFWWMWTTVFQMWVLIVVIAGFTNTRRALSFSLGAFLLGAIIVGAYGVFTGEYQQAAMEEERVLSLAANANEFGWIMLLATAAMAYFWMLPTRLRVLKYVVLAAGMGALALAIVYSGSRKAILGVAAFYPAWVWWCYRKEMLRRPALALSVLAAVALVVAGVILFSRELPVAVRFRETWTSIGGGAAGEGTMARLWLYQEAWRIFLKYPVVGVGLNNYQMHAALGINPHSEYAGLVCDTGLVGAALYLSIFVVLWRRAGKIIAYSRDPHAVRVAGLIRAFLVIVLLLAFGRENTYDKPFWLMLAAFIGYTGAVWHDLRARLAADAAVAPAGDLLRAPAQAT